MRQYRIAASRWLAAVALAAVSLSGGAAEQAYPTKPIRLLVPFAPGGIGDITARLVAQKMSENMGQQVVVDNRPGAGMILSATAAMQAAPDGYTLIQAGNGTAISATLFKSLPYDILKDFVQLSTMAYFDLIMVANADAKLASVGDVLDFARKNPGKLSIGTISIGSTQHLAAELFVSMAGLEVQIVPFKATTAVITALRSNDIPVAVEIVPAVMPQIKSGAVKALAVASSKRFAGLPNTPTIAESGVPGYEASSWTALSVRAQTPRPIVERLHKEIAAAVNSPDVKQKLNEIGAEARASASPAEARKLMAAEISKWKAVIERAKIERQ